MPLEETALDLSPFLDNQRLQLAARHTLRLLAAKPCYQLIELLFGGREWLIDRECSRLTVF